MERLFNSFATLTFPDSFPRGKISATGEIYTGNWSAGCLSKNDGQTLFSRQDGARTRQAAG